MGEKPSKGECARFPRIRTSIPVPGWVVFIYLDIEMNTHGHTQKMV